MFSLKSIFYVIVVLHCCPGLQTYKNYRFSEHRFQLTQSKTKRNALVEGTAASLFSGAIAGSLGVGASYPLDSIKTKSQALASTRAKDEKSPGMLKMFSIVYDNEGISGFYQGVVGVMIGQAFIKSTLFAGNALGLALLIPQTEPGTLLSSCVCACTYAGN